MTALEVVGNVARFHVHTSSSVYAELLLAMGFPRSGENRFTREVPATPDIARIHENLARHVEEILLQHAGIRPVPWRPALREFARRLEGTEVNWWLAGSAALAVRGIDVAPRDLDFAVSDSHAVGRLFHDVLVEPVTYMKGWVADWFGRAFFGALIEWVSDVHSSDHGHGLEQGPGAESRLERVEWEGLTIPVTPLDIQLVVAERRGQQDRAAKIRELSGPKRPSLGGDGAKSVSAHRRDPPRLL